MVIVIVDEVLLEGCSRSNRRPETVKRTAVEMCTTKKKGDDRHADPSLEYGV
jgi:hypothetical protein